MGAALLICLGLIFIVIGIILFFRRKKLYRDGIKARGKVVGIETYTYLTQGSEYNTLYYTGITPIIEVEDDGKKVRVAYSSIEDYSDLSEGDEIEVIYPKDRVNELVRFNEKEFYRDSIYISMIGLLILMLGLILKLIEFFGSI